MELTNLSQIKELLQKHRLWAKKNLGQNFLVDPQALLKIVEAGQLSKEDTVLEIGPGLGVLTQKLCQLAGQVLAIEKDSELLPVLKETCSEFQNLKVLNEDALKFKVPSPESRVPNLNYKVVANIPYYITSPLINKFLRNEYTVKTALGEKPQLPEAMIFLIQKEVAEKICLEKKYKKRYSVLSLNVHIFGEPEMISRVPKDSFYPAPKVDSAIIRINVYKTPKLSKKTINNLPEFFHLIETAFKNPRKKIHNGLIACGMNKEKAIEILQNAKIDINLRPENLEISDWENLFTELETKAS